LKIATVTHPLPLYQQQQILSLHITHSYNTNTAVHIITIWLYLDLTILMATYSSSCHLPHNEYFWRSDSAFIMIPFTFSHHTQHIQLSHINQFLVFILFNDQLETQFFFVYVYFSSLHVSSIQVLIIRRFNFINTSGICHSDYLVCRFGRSVQTCFPDGHLHRVTYTRSCIDTIESPDDEHLNAQNM